MFVFDLRVRRFVLRARYDFLRLRKYAKEFPWS